MRKLLGSSLAVGLVLALAHRAPAQEELQAIVDKAIKAQGGADKLAKAKAFRTKAKGTLEIMGGLKFTSESVAQLKGQIKEVTQVEINGQKVTVTTVFNGTKGWINTAGQTIDMDEKMVEAMKEGVYHLRLHLLLALKDKAIQLAPLGEIKVNDRPAVGVKVSSKGHKDVNMYFDKENGLLVKTEHRTIDFMNGVEVNEETVVSDYQDHDGFKTAKKIVMHHDGKKYLDAEVTDFKILDKEFDEDEFAKP